jgi:hypothetical protein
MKDTDLIMTVNGMQQLDRVKRAVELSLGFKLYGISINGRDTEFSYLLYAEGRLNKIQLTNLRAFIRGAMAMYQIMA